MPRQLVTLALQGGEQHARPIGAALAAWDDDTAAYRILKAACEALIDEVTAGGAARWAPRAVALLELVRPWLQRRPAEPVLLNYAGVALYGLNEAALAVRVLEAAERLDPSLENLAGNLGAAKARAPAREPLLPPRERPAVNAVGPPERRREAGRRRPPTRSHLALHDRADEEEMLPECLASCATASTR